MELIEGCPLLERIGNGIYIQFCYCESVISVCCRLVIILLGS